MNINLDDIKYVVDNSSSIKINYANLIDYAGAIINVDKIHWLDKSPCPIVINDFRKKINIIFLIDAISFCYWREPKWKYINGPVARDGTWGLICAIVNAVNSGAELYNYSYLKSISLENFKNIFIGENTLPLIEERFNVAKEIADRIIQKYQGEVINLIEECKGDALILLDSILKNFESFQDHSIYEGRIINFNKRAQLATSDLSHELSKNKYPMINVDKLTACADYKLPYVLNNFGILEYNNSLMEKILSKQEIVSDSDEEIEIRANTIWAVKRIVEELRPRMKDVTQVDVNDYLWLLSQDKSMFKFPYHRTNTIKY